jgi:hypothetical protein
MIKKKIAPINHQTHQQTQQIPIPRERKERGKIADMNGF